jgi:hypothetical protein
MSAIFISYNTKDSATAREVHEGLLRSGYGAVFFAPHAEDGIVAGAPWEQVLYHRLRCCAALVAICSTNSAASKWCFAEIALALAMRKRVFPIKLDGADLPEILQRPQHVELNTGVAGAEIDVWMPRLLTGLESAGIPTGRWERSRPPYPGFGAFDERDAPVFFGRERNIAELESALIECRASSLKEGQGRWLLVTGQSGSGKSSLLRAGVMPRLRADRTRWLALNVMRPGDQPFEQLALAFTEMFRELGDTRQWQDLRDALREGNLTKVSDDITSLRARAEQPEGTIVLIIDQFEELLGAAQARAIQFVELLRRLSALPGRQVCVCTTLRSDFIGAFENHEALRQLGQRHVAVNPLREEDLRGVIEGPALMAGIEIEDQLVDRLVREVAADAATPFLAFALRDLYDTFNASTCWTLQAYRDRVGSLRDAVSATATRALAREHGDLSVELSLEAKAALLSLASIDQQDRVVRRKAPWSELPESTHSLIEAFIAARLLVSDRDSVSTAGDTIDTPERYVEVAHEALMRSWPVFRDLIAQETAFLKWRSFFQQSLKRWVDAPSEQEALATGPMISAAAKYHRAGLFLVSALENEFLEESTRYQMIEQGRLDKTMFPPSLEVLLFEGGQRLHIKFKRRAQNYRHIFLVPLAGALFALAVWSHIGTRAGNSWFVVAFLAVAFAASCYDQFRAIARAPVLELDLFQRRVKVRGASPKESLHRPKEGDVLVATGTEKQGYYARVLYGYEYEIARAACAATEEEALLAVLPFARTLNRAMGLHEVRVVADVSLLEPNVMWKNPLGKQR